MPCDILCGWGALHCLSVRLLQRVQLLQKCGWSPQGVHRGFSESSQRVHCGRCRSETIPRRERAATPRPLLQRWRMEHAVRLSHSCSAKMGWPPVCLPTCLSMKGTQRYKHRRPIWSTASLFLVGQAPPLFV